MIHQKTIAQIIDQNHVFASVLYYFGVDFYNYSETTLEELCKSKGLRLNSVVEAFEKIDQDEQAQHHLLLHLPVDLILEYLKHSHYVFVKKKLPFLARQIQALSPTDGPSDLINDLQWVFPVFTEDFIHHIYQEEDQLFTYILELHAVLNHVASPSKVYFKLERGSLQRFSVVHATHDEEMNGFDKILEGIRHGQGHTSQRLRVISNELQDFKQLIRNHGRVENEILFPKALALENKVKEIFKELSTLN